MMSYDWLALQQQQDEIARRVILENHIPPTLDSIAGVDVSFTRFATKGYAALVVLSYPQLAVMERVHVMETLEFPYIPGYLAFREWPLIRACIDQLHQRPGLLLCDGHGLAHPRRAGLACHVGVESGLITIGCAKSRFIGEYEEPGMHKGNRSNLVYQGEKVGEVVRTRDHVKPLFISPGHRVDFRAATEWILSVCRRYRHPLPLRMAHQAVNSYRSQQERETVFLE